jgi:hypothetical protein
MASYSVIADSFSRASLWDDFLGYHYAGRKFTANAMEAVNISRASQIPWAGTISVSDISATANRVAPGDVITLSTTITGENIGIFISLQAWLIRLRIAFLWQIRIMLKALHRHGGGCLLPHLARRANLQAQL